MEVVGLLLRVGCVFALLFVVLHLLKKTDALKSAKRAGELKVLGSTRLGKGAALTVVRIGGSEYVLGVTDHAVTLLTPATPVAAEEPVAAEAPAAADFASALRARLGSSGGAAAQVPPTPAEFLKSAYRVARRRPAESTDLSTDAVTAALANVRGDAAPAAPAVHVPAPRTPLPVVPDGPATPTSRHALRRAVARTDALRHEEHLWTRSCRPTSRTSDLDATLA